MTELQHAKEVIKTFIETHHEIFDQITMNIWAKSEIAFEEYEAVTLQKGLLEQYGFTITQKDGLPTAFMAEWGSGSPVIGFLGEYDALGGLSQKVCAQKEPIKAGEPGHGCGHNLLGMGCLLAACAAKEALEKAGIQGTIRYYGCPGEEQLTGKGKMAELGYFEETDIALTWHPADYSVVAESTFTAMFSAKFSFKGISSHAGAAPDAGRSALDAVELMNIGANYLREHMLDQDRLHYVITNGGVAPNIVPPEAEVWYFGRAPHVDELVLLWKRLNKVAEGASIMTETTYSVELLGGCYNTLNNPALCRVVEENLLQFAGKIPHDDKDIAFAKQLQETIPKDMLNKTLKRLPITAPGESVLASTPLPSFEKGTFIMGSTDVGDVGHIMPTAMFWGASYPLGVPGHSWQLTASVGSPIGLKATWQAATTLAGTAFDCAANPEFVQKAKEEFANERQEKPYQSIASLLK